MAHVTAAGYRFVARPAHETSDAALLVPDPEQSQAIRHRVGPLLVRGGPGTGKTTVLIEAVAARVAEGTDPGRILVLGFGRRGAADLRRRISVRLSVTGAEVPVYSFPAYAFALLRKAAAKRDEPAPHLLKGPEQDVIIRDLLATDTVAWPEAVHPALGTRAFAAQLRDLLLRATERGISAPRLAELGRRHDRPEWVSAAAFMTRYVDILALRSMTGGASYDSAEIVRAAATEVADDGELITRPHYTFVDELQDIDPAQLELLKQVAGDGANLTCFGDTDSATFGFRGGDVSVMREFCDRFPTATGEPAPATTLTVCHRAAAAPLAASTVIAQRLRGSDRHRHRHPRPEVGDGQVSATALRSGTQQAAFIAAQLREAHLRDGVEWSQMAVIVKSAAEHLPVIARALRHSQVPVDIAADDQPLSVQPVVRNLLTIIQCGLNPKLLDEETAVTLLHSAYGGADALTERKLRQELRRIGTTADVFRPTGELLVEALRDPTELAELPEEAWAEPPRKIAALMEHAREAKGSVEDVLWRVWEAAGLAPRLARRAVSSDSRAVGADSDLDAMMSLFDWAADFSDRLPGAGPEMFAAHVLEQILPADTLAAHARRGEAVQLMTAHTAKGRQWDLVVVAGVQEGHWPNLRPRGSLLGAEYLVEAVTSGVAADVDTMSVLLDEERRLYYAACTRARDRLIVTCVSDEDENQPSRFVTELGVEVAEPSALERPMTLPALVASLRGAACGPEGPDREAAIALLARLAREGVPGADPEDWWGLRPLSDDRPLALPGERLKVSPSSIELMDQCGLRWLLEKHGGDEPSGVSQQIGNLVHAAAEAAATLPRTEQEAAMTEFIDQHAQSLPSLAPWTAQRDRQDLSAMTSNYLQWLHRNDRAFIAAERGFAVDLPSGDTGVNLRLSGIVDRIEHDLHGGVHVVDLKTGKYPPTAAEADANPQLAAYQLAVERGGFADLHESTTAAGASLVYVAKDHQKTGSVVRQQEAPGNEAADQARDKVITAAQAMTANTFEAVHGKKCDTCRVKSSCPISGKGKPVTQ